MRRITLAMATLVLLLTAACGSGDTRKSDEGGATGGLSAAATGSVGSPTAGEARSSASPAGAAAPAASAAVARAAAASAIAGAAPAQSGVDPCRVVTEEELEAALGFTLKPGERTTGPIGEPACVYRAERDQTPGTMPNVTVAVWRSRLARTTYDGIREAEPAGRVMDVPGLGDSAYVFANAGSAGTDFRSVAVLKGDVLFTIEVAAILYPPVSMNQEEKRANLIAVARTALGRL